MSTFIYRLSQTLAWIGGFVLTSMAILSVASIVGRTFSGFGLGPVPGDFELVEAGTALAVFCFLPWTHLRSGHAVVDLFWKAYPPTMQRALVVVADSSMLMVWGLLVWRMGVSMEDYRENGEVSFILQMPVWWGYASSMVPALIGCVVYAWRLLERLGLVAAPRDFASTGAAH